MADLYIDYSRARPSVELIKSLGCVGAVRYLSDRNLADSSTNRRASLRRRLRSFWTLV